jgi:hypothetical protein
MPVRSISQIDNVTELKNLDVSQWDDAVKTGIYLISKSAGVVDGLGGVYQWDATSNAPEDLINLNFIASNTSSTGRWVRSFQRARTYPQGILTFNGGIKILYVKATTNSSGEATIYLTTDNTANGPLIFSEIYDNYSYATSDAANWSLAVQSFIKISAETGNLKTTTHGFYKMQSINPLLGGLIPPLVMVGSGVPVTFAITGV